jgi:iron complex outermembrane receptor protein
VLFAVGRVVSPLNLPHLLAPSRAYRRVACLSSVTLLFVATSAWSQSSTLGPVVVSPPKQAASRQGSDQQGAAKHTKRAARNTAAKPVPKAEAATPLNGNAVAGSASHLGLSVHETPATVEVVSQQTMREQGYRTTSETAIGAVGVLAGDAGGSFGAFSMRGFTGSRVNILYNGIWIGPQDATSRIMDTGNLEQVEFVKGPEALMSGISAIGGTVNYVNRQPTSGPIKSELDTSIDTLGTYRTHFGSGGSTLVPGLDYRFDASSSRINSRIDGVDDQLNNFSGQLNYRVTDSLKVWGAVEYKRDDGHAYWGSPLTTTAFSGPNSTHSVVAGNALNIFKAADPSDTTAVFGPVTVDSRTTHTNYNIAGNRIDAHELWLRGGFEFNIGNAVTFKNQTYSYGAKRQWFDAETYAFDTGTSMIDRDRFFVTHKQQVAGNISDLVLNSAFAGMENRFAGSLQVSRYAIKYQQEGGNTYPFDSVTVLNPDPGFYPVPVLQSRNSRLDNVALSIEDRLKVTPWLALIGGVRIEDLALSRDGINANDPNDPTSVVTIPRGLPFTKTWDPVSYRAAATVEPVKGLMLYTMTATAYDPSGSANAFTVSPGTTLELTSARIYETGIKAISPDKRAEFTFAAYDIERRNVYVQVTNAIAAIAGEVHSRGVEIAGALRPVEPLKLWGNVAFTESRYGDFDFFTGNTPSNIAPVIVNAGASWRWDHWRWPVEIGGSIRHVGQRYVYEDDRTAMLPYTTADLFAFVDVPGRDLPWQGLHKMRFAFRVRNVTNALYAQWSDPGYPDQVYLGAPRTFELSASARW